jgi:hypothetical protein
MIFRRDTAIRWITDFVLAIPGQNQSEYRCDGVCRRRPALAQSLSLLDRHILAFRVRHYPVLFFQQAHYLRSHYCFSYPTAWREASVSADDLKLQKTWEDIAERVSHEQNPEKLTELAHELIEALDEQAKLRRPQQQVR